jgi:hypothetical protein
MRARLLFAMIATCATNLFATDFYGAGGSPLTRQFILDDDVVMVSAFGFDHSKPIEVLLEDLSTDGQGLRFSVVAVNGETTTYTAPAVGTYSFSLPAAVQVDPISLTISDLVGGFPFCLPGACAQDQGRLPQSFRLTLRQTTVIQETLQLEVKTKDHMLGNPQIYVFSEHVINKSTTLSVSDFVLRYSFTIEATSNAPTMLDYYTPVEKACLRRSVQHPLQFVLDLDFQGTTLLPGASTLGAVENQIHIHYANYASINKGNDWSNPIPVSGFALPWNTLFTVNTKAAVLDHARTTVLSGQVNPATVGDTWTAYAGECN